MRSAILSLALVAIGTTQSVSVVRADETPASTNPDTPTNRVTLARTQEFSLKAKANDREYRIRVTEPSTQPPPAGYPVIYLLDGNANFATMVEIARAQRIAGVVIVGIGYPSDAPFDARRTYDFTPPSKQGKLEALLGAAEEPTGGNDEFLDFIEKDLKPDIEKRFNINRHRQTLVGHSLGGLFVLHVLFTRGECFQNYVAGSPSIWWNDQSILAEERAFIAKRGVKADLLVFVGALESGYMVHDAQRVTERLATLSAEGLRVYYTSFENENHASVLPAGLSRAYRFALDGSEN
jgi:predicted alpha/beta superfamily hydrolase